MRVLFIGDIFGKPGRRILQEKLHGLIQEHRIDFCVANAENAAGGFGITPQIADELLRSEIDLLTSGNHIWDKRAIIPYLASQPRLLRPYNYPASAPGTGIFVGDSACGVRLAVINIQGRVFMPTLDCPFGTGTAAVEYARTQTKVIIVDFHAEASSEKQAFAWYMDGRVSAVLGTHTHVQTADERILPKGTAFMTDVGMTGPHDSIIGSVPDLALDRFLRQMPTRLEPASGNLRLCGAVIEIDESTGRARGILRLNVAETRG
ncbi:MAG TPA: TIGR00282 family metallophosphoesterase [Acidobacteriota bacterium]|nr:TIGR00282 family metallophosphoesterase [Acidobacteriota bacterium]